MSKTGSETIQQNPVLRLVPGLGMALGAIGFNVIMILTLHGLGIDLSTPLPPTMWSMLPALSAVPFFVMAESDLPAIVRNSGVLRWEARVLYSSSYLGSIVLWGGFNGLGPYRDSIVEVLIVILVLLAIFFFIRLCIAERQNPGNLSNP
jgi:hypothetical protein